MTIQENQEKKTKKKNNDLTRLHDQIIYDMLVWKSLDQGVYTKTISPYKLTIRFLCFGSCWKT